MKKNWVRQAVPSMVNVKARASVRWFRGPGGAAFRKVGARSAPREPKDQSRSAKIPRAKGLQQHAFLRTVSSALKGLLTITRHVRITSVVRRIMAAPCSGAANESLPASIQVLPTRTDARGREPTLTRTVANLNHGSRTCSNRILDRMRRLPTRLEPSASALDDFGIVRLERVPLGCGIRRAR